MIVSATEMTSTDHSSIFGPILPEDDDTNDKGLRAPYSHALDSGFLSHGITVPENQMIQLINQITDKSEWQWKVFDETVVRRWRNEAYRGWSDGVDGFSAQMFDFCMLELREKARRLKETGHVTVLDCEVGIVKSDTAVPESLKERLRQCVAQLEDRPDSEKHWHPGSDEMVLDLLHPSLFPVIYGTTRALPDEIIPLEDCMAFIGKGEIVDSPTKRATNRASNTWQPRESKYWGNYQWLPSIVKSDENGKPRIVSYINNLHPQKHQDHYGVFEDLVAAAIPLWDETLSWDRVKNFRINLEDVSFSDNDYFVPEQIRYMLDDVEKRILAQYNASLLEGDEIDMDRGLSMNKMKLSDILWLEDAPQAWFHENRVLKPLEPYDFDVWLSKSKEKPALDLQSEYRDGLQVIFKLANIHLTPDKPEYDGGSWHIEGALNESICATAIYYFDQDNITDSYLAFRQQVNDERMFQIPTHNQSQSMEAYYGIENNETAIQSLGSVLTRENRLLTFPNIVQHQVQPFRLLDSSRPGHRKLLAMFLVDPSHRIPSTANVPPQRRDWWSPEVRKVPPFNELPLEVFEIIVGFVDDFPISWEAALEVRRKLMESRGALARHNNRQWDETKFNFCEH